MKKTFTLILTFIFSIPVFAQVNGAVTQDFFQLPIIPDSISTLQSRCDYMVTHYWDYCDLKKAFSSPDKMADAFDMYISFMPYASADAVYGSVDKFIKDISKKAENVEFITTLAEEKIFSDSAEFRSEDLYLHFLENALKNKKVNKNFRAKYSAQAECLTNSREGATAAPFQYTDSAGVVKSFQPDPSQFATLLMFIKPGDSASDMARLRLDADYKTSQLIKSGRVKIYCICATEEGTLPSPQGWEIGRAPQITEKYYIPEFPMFYIVNSEGKILKKGADVEPVLNVMQLLRVPRKKAETTPQSTDQPE